MKNSIEIFGYLGTIVVSWFFPSWKSEFFVEYCLIAMQLFEEMRVIFS